MQKNEYSSSYVRWHWVLQRKTKQRSRVEVAMVEAAISKKRSGEILPGR